MMKRLRTYFLSLIPFWSALAIAEVPDTVFLPVEKVYSIQSGFDTNDNTEIAVWGYLPNTCYKVNKGVAHVDHQRKKILVNVEGHHKKLDICLEMRTPYLEVIQVGLLKGGKYEVQSVLNADVKGQLEVSESASSNRDEYLYAPVDSVDLNQVAGFALSQQELVLRGRYPYMLKGCMRITEVKTSLNSNNVLVVQPISKIFEDEECFSKDVDHYNRFNVKTEIPQSSVGQILIHVRTLNGKAINKMVELGQ